MSDTSSSLDSGFLKNVKGSLSLVQNFYIEFFGTLIPGLFGIVCLVSLAMWCCHVLGVDIKTTVEPIVGKVGGMVVLTLLLFLLTVAYIIGAVAYRRSPKIPDAISSYRQWLMTQSSSASDEVGRMSVPFDFSSVTPSGIIERVCFWFNRGEWLLRRAGSCIDYPYPLMRKYLYCRGLKHLAEYVPWCAGSGGAAFRETFRKGVCSKTYINLIKQRLRSAGHESLIMDMIRNECHIRMLCSLWYILAFVIRVSIIAVIGVTLLLYCKFTEAIPLAVFFREMTGSIVVIITGLGMLSYCRYSTERGLHYVRTREVTMILESAWILDNVDFKGRLYVKLENGRALFQDIKDQAMAFKESHCSNCKYCRQCHGDETAV